MNDQIPSALLVPCRFCGGGVGACGMAFAWDAITERRTDDALLHMRFHARRVNEFLTRLEEQS
jgi:hypothetical protein